MRGDESHLIRSERRGRRSLQCFRYISLVRERELSQEQGYANDVQDFAEDAQFCVD